MYIKYKLNEKFKQFVFYNSFYEYLIFINVLKYAQSRTYDLWKKTNDSKIVKSFFIE